MIAQAKFAIVPKAQRGGKRVLRALSAANCLA
jgi:hypothetical protein